MKTVKAPVYVPSDSRAFSPKKETEEFSGVTSAPVKAEEKKTHKEAPNNFAKKKKEEEKKPSPEVDRHLFKGSHLKTVVPVKGSPQTVLVTPLVPRSSAQVKEIDLEKGFIIVDAGSQDGIAKNTPLNVMRGGRVIAKAVVKEVRPGTSAAVILPEWTKQDIKKDDQISLA